MTISDSETGGDLIRMVSMTSRRFCHRWHTRTSGTNLVHPYLGRDIFNDRVPSLLQSVYPTAMMPTFKKGKGGILIQHQL